ALQRFIVEQLTAIHPRVYLEWAPQGATYPLVVYQLPTSDEVIERREDFILEVDVWDQPEDGSTIASQNLSDRIDQAFNRLSYTDAGGWSSRFYRVNRLMIPDPDPNIRRRQLRYEIRTYRRGT